MRLYIIQTKKLRKKHEGYVAHSMSHIYYITEIEFLFRLSSSRTHSLSYGGFFHSLIILLTPFIILFPMYGAVSFSRRLKEIFSSRSSIGDISMCVQKNTLHKKVSREMIKLLFEVAFFEKQNNSQFFLIKFFI